MVSLSKAAGRLVECGDVIQLLHVRSKLFLTMLKSRATMEESAMRLELLADGCQYSIILSKTHMWPYHFLDPRSEYSQWTLQPGYKTSKRGERCAFGIPITLECTKQAGVYVHVSTSKQKVKTSCLLKLFYVNIIMLGDRSESKCES